MVRNVECSRRASMALQDMRYFLSLFISWTHLDLIGPQTRRNIRSIITRSPRRLFNTTTQTEKKKKSNKVVTRPCEHSVLASENEKAICM